MAAFLEAVRWIGCIVVAILAVGLIIGAITVGALIGVPLVIVFVIVGVAWAFKVLNDSAEDDDDPFYN